MPKSTSDIRQAQVAPYRSVEKRTRRRFSVEYKLRIPSQADACQHGELDMLSRREKLYSGQLSIWLREYAETGAVGLSKSVLGPIPTKTPDVRRVEQLEKEDCHLQHKVGIANDCLELKRNALVTLDRLRNGSAV
jgi:transposase-like protein